MLRRIIFLITVLLTALTTSAQVTTSGINGKVTASGEEAIGATITAKHLPSGTVYRAVTNVDGLYSITGMRAGGPYDIEVSYIGYQTKKFTDIQLALGENALLDAWLAENSQMLQEVEVVAATRNTMRSDRSGAVTSLNATEMSVIPTVSHNMNDLLKMTPQGNSSNGMAIGGGNFRQSNITVDGASFNNSFGLTQNVPLPGGGTPISIDALDQLTVSITPFDVRLSGFTGGGINAVTRSGTNEFKGSLYTYLTSTSLKGSRVGDATLDVDNGHTNTYGFTLGGPILKDKLFFFVNGEIEDNVTVGPSKRAGDGTLPYTETNSRPTIEQLESLSGYLRSNYGLETGAWQGYNVKTPAYRILARLDWNINDNHHFHIRFNKSNRKDSKAASTSRNIGGSQLMGIYGAGTAYGNSAYGMSSLSSRYYMEYRFTSLAAELNSKFGKLQNTLRATYSFQDQPRSTEYGDTAPVLELVMSDGQGHYPTWALTGDIFTYGTLSQTKNTVITDEVNVTLGKHHLFAGLQFEHNYASNGYAQAAAGYYAYEVTPDEAEAGNWGAVFSRSPRVFGITYGNGADHSIFKAEMKTNQWSLYLQDNINLSDRFRMSAGVRLELPSYPALDGNFNEDYYNIKFGDQQFRTDNVPSNSISCSPRIGFNWDILNNRKYILRGGTGLFVGRLPFAWLVSSVLNSGMGQTTYVATTANGKTAPTFTTSQQDMLQQVNATSATSVPSGPTILSDDLRMPKTWKTSLAFDAKLPGDIDFTLEGIYSHDLNPVVVSNKDFYWDGSSTVDLGHGDIRHNVSSYYNASAQSAYVLENAGSGAYYLSLSAQLRKKFDFGLDLMASYTISKAKTFSDGIGDQASGAYYTRRYSIHAINDNEKGYATYVAPNRLLVAASYRLKESSNATSVFSLVYDGYQCGYLDGYSFNRYSYFFSSNVTGDARGCGNLLYVPASREELNNWNFADNGMVDGKPYTADMQRDDFWAFICQDDYLSSRKGQYTERGGAKMPWHHQLDFKYQRDMSINWGKTRHTLQLGLDILNLPNFLCKDWGLYKAVPVGGDALLNYNGTQYTYNLVNGKRHLSTFQNYESAASTYQVMFTIRYLFN